MRSLPVFLLAACTLTPVRVEMHTERTFRGGDPRKADVTITGADQKRCDAAFASHVAAPPPSPEHTKACSELRYDAGVCKFYCEITGPL